MERGWICVAVSAQKLWQHRQQETCQANQRPAPVIVKVRPWGVEVQEAHGGFSWGNYKDPSWRRWKMETGTQKNAFCSVSWGENNWNGLPQVLFWITAVRWQDVSNPSVLTLNRPLGTRPRLMCFAATFDQTTVWCWRLWGGISGRPQCDSSFCSSVMWAKNNLGDAADSTSCPLEHSYKQMKTAGQHLPYLLECHLHRK